MSSFKQNLLIAAVSATTGALISFFIFPLAIKTNFLNTATILSKTVSQPSPAAITKVEEKPAAALDGSKVAGSKPSVTQQPNYFSDAIGRIQPSVVAIQSFYDGALIRSGSGIILTQDGLIATLNSLAPSSADFFQVADDGKMYKAKVVFRDFAKNIALISIPGANLSVVRLKSDMPILAQNLLVFSKFVDFNKDSPLIEEALVSQLDVIKNQFTISVPYGVQLYGGAVMDNEGNILGLLDFRSQKPMVLFSKIIGDVLNAYLTKNARL